MEKAGVPGRRIAPVVRDKQAWVEESQPVSLHRCKHVHFRSADQSFCLKVLKIY
jgi:hypothetical protein